MTPTNEAKFRAILNDVALTALEDDANRTKTGIPNYDADDLLSATIIFQHVFSVLAIKLTMNELEFVESCERAEKMGAELREYIMKYTGVDMWKHVVKHKKS